MTGKVHVRANAPLSATCRSCNEDLHSETSCPSIWTRNAPSLVARLKTMKSMRDFVVTASKMRVADVHCTAALLPPLRYDQPVPQTRRHWRRPQRVGR